MAWNWLSPIPGTLYTQQYKPNQNGFSPNECIAGDAPRSASPVVALEVGAAVRLDDLASTVGDKSKTSGIVGIFSILRQYKIGQSFPTRLALLQVRACRANGGGG